MSLQTFVYSQKFKLESGEELPDLEVGYHTFGKLNNNKDNVVWVCHALTANSNVVDWWQGLFGDNCLFNPQDYFIVCANNLGSTYGTTGALSQNKYTHQQWFSHFPHITIRDMVNAHELLRQHLNIENINTIIGGSQGAQQVMEWNILNPQLFKHTILIATNAKHSAWGVAFNESQRLAIKADRTYYANTITGGQKGLAVARSIALLSYRNYDTYNESQNEKDNFKVNDFNAASYQRYQGEKLINRFNAYSYITLLNAMDSHNVGRGKYSIESALQTITAKTLVVGISSDILFPPQEQMYLSHHIKNSYLKIIDSLYGHDGFLLETVQLTQIISEFLNEHKTINTNVTRSKIESN